MNTTRAEWLRSKVVPVLLEVDSRTLKFTDIRRQVKCTNKTLEELVDTWYPEDFQLIKG